MIPAPFDYHRPSSLDEAIKLLTKHGGEAKVLSGGMSLLPTLKLRLGSFAHLVDINRIAGLDGIKEEGGALRIGALTRQAALERSELIRKRLPILGDAVPLIADPLVRNRGTVGGNLAHADPANDHPAVMLAAGATMVARGARGAREIPADEFFVGLFESALAPGELLVEIRVPTPGKGQGAAYEKIERKVGDYAITGVAVSLTLDGDTCRAARIGLTNVSAVPMRARAAEAALAGRKLTDDVLEAAGQAAAKECDPSADLRGSVEFKRDLTRVVLKRAARRAAARAKGAAA